MTIQRPVNEVNRPLPQPPSEAFDLSSHYVQLVPGGASNVVRADGTPPNVPGYLIGAGLMTQPPPHNGECHQDGDELLVVITGSVAVTVEKPEGEHTTQVSEGEAFVVPQGHWHRVRPRTPARLLFVTPGPNNETRPLRGE